MGCITAFSAGSLLFLVYVNDVYNIYVWGIMLQYFLQMKRY